jgi:predicted RNase H-like nuclease (RuvC/YqgF family)
MSSLAPILMSVFGGGAVTGSVAAGRWITDERARRRSEKTSASLAPLRQKSYELRVAAQADEVLQDTIDTLRENLRELKTEFAQYRADTNEQRQRDLVEHGRQRALDHEELDRLHQEVSDQSATIAALRFELQGYKSGTGP